MQYINPAPDQSSLDVWINASYQTVRTYPDHILFTYELLSRIDEEVYY
jgi:hypothetical protein